MLTYLYIILLFILIIIILIIKSNNIEYFGNYTHDHCYMINLKNTKEGKRRWNIIKNHPYWNNIDIERIDGVNGYNIDIDSYVKKNIIKRKWNYGKWKGIGNKYINMSKGEVGCCLSHLKVWKKIVDNNIKRTLVLEDDPIKIKNNINTILKKIMKNIPKNWDIILISFWLHKGDNGYKINKDFYKVKDFALTPCYLISLNGANKLLKLLPIDRPVDSWLSHVSNKINIYRHNIIRPYSKYPSSSLVRQSTIKSQIAHTNNF